MTTTGDEIRCAACGKTFPWNVRFAGRKVRCPCGQVMDYPQQQPASHSEDDLYDLVPDAPTAQRAPQSAAPAASPPPPPEPKPPAVLGYRNPSTAALKPDLDVDQIKNFTGPLWILGGGLAIEACITLWNARTDVGAAMLHLVVNVGVDTILMMVGVLIAARVRQINIGSFGSALLRLAAVSIAPAAVSDLLAPVALFIPILGFLGLFVVSFALYFALLGMFFDLDESDTWLCVWVIFLINLAVYFGERWVR